MATSDRQISPSTRERRLQTEQKWRQILEEQQKSGLKQTAFCRQKGIPAHRLTVSFLRDCPANPILAI